VAAVGAVLSRLALDLNDAAPGHEHTAWPKRQLRLYVEDAVRVLFDHKPECFMREAVIELAACAGYSPVDPCDSLAYDGVQGECSEGGHLLRRLRPCSDAAAVRWTGRACPAPNPYRMREFAIAKDGKGVRVAPELPPGQRAWLSVRCPVRPTKFTDETVIDEALVPAVVQWCLFQAKMTDSENNPAVLVSAKEHEEEFWKLLGVPPPDEKRGRRGG
jgi:hypothetical protein